MDFATWMQKAKEALKWAKEKVAILEGPNVDETKIQVNFLSYFPKFHWTSISVGGSKFDETL